MIVLNKEDVLAEGSPYVMDDTDELPSHHDHAQVGVLLALHTTLTLCGGVIRFW